VGPASRSRPPAPPVSGPWQLDQRERVAVCLGDDPVAHALVQRAPDQRGQQRARQRPLDPRPRAQAAPKSLLL
jgi:hypothetical protein